MFLYNRISREELKKRLHQETFTRKTISFYRYFYISDPQSFRDQIYQDWNAINCFGRIYVAKEGINAQMSVPEHHFEAFLDSLKNYEIFQNIPIKYAVEDDGKSFYKLTIKVRPKLVADGLEDRSFDVTNVGNHLSGLEFHNLVGKEDTIVVDMRNYYESEIGYFEGAICPEADTFREELDIVSNELKGKEDKKLLLYCTGGIRCEKASAYLKHQGFNDVNQLHGGIIEYARQIKEHGIESKFIGKNFVFDERMGESISGKIVAHCHQCGSPFDTHSNCANDSCHLLFIQCPSCAKKYNNCCSDDCKEELKLSLDGAVPAKKANFGNRKKYRKSLRLTLKEKANN